MQTQSTTNVNTDTIAKRAYEIWQRKGKPTGRADANWRQAEMEVRISQSHEAERTAQPRAVERSAAPSDNRAARQAARPNAVS